MKGRALLLDRGAHWEAAALIEDGRLSDLLLEERRGGSAEKAVGGAALAPEALCAARVARRSPHVDGAFVTLGDGAPDGPRAYLTPAGDLREGDAVLCEIRAHAEEGKAWPATRRLTLRSRRLALTPGAPGINISRSVQDEGARAALRRAVTMGLSASGGDAARLGCVVRTVASDEPEGLEAEAAWLSAQWRLVEEESAERSGVLRAAPGPIALALREWRAAAARLLTTPRSLEGSGAPLEAAMARTIAPSDPLRARIEAAEPDLFERFDVAGQAEEALGARAPLGRGAWAVMEPTKALIAMDVNSGAAMNALDADLAAAAAAPRLLRLGGLGGLVAIDFISKAAAPRARIEQALKRALKVDPVETTLLGWTSGGLFELTRRRARRPVSRDALARWRRESG